MAAIMPKCVPALPPGRARLRGAALALATGPHPASLLDIATAARIVAEERPTATAALRTWSLAAARVREQLDDGGAPEAALMPVLDALAALLKAAGLERAGGRWQWPVQEVSPGPAPELEWDCGAADLREVVIAPALAG